MSTQKLRELAQRFGLIISFLLLCAVLALLSDRFLTVNNAVNILRQSTINGIIAVGMTFVILTAGIDLSVGATLALSSVVTANLLQQGVPVWLAVLTGLALGAALGFLNGIIITKARVPPFVATFGMLVFVQGARLAYTKGQASGTVPDLLRLISIEQLGPIPAALIVWLIINAIVIFTLRYTRIGRWVYAVGGNPGAARYAGINVDWVLISAHIVCSVLAIMGGLLLSGYIGYVDLRLGAEYNMNSIAAAVVGGTTFTGGRGNLFGTAAGVALLIMLLNLVVVLGLPIHWQYAMQGIVLVLATALQGFRQFLLAR